LMFKVLNLFFISILCVHICWSQASDNAVKFQTLWQFEDENLSESRILLTEQGLIVPLDENRFILLDADSGETLWTIEITSEIVLEPFVNEGYLYIITSLPDTAKTLKKFSLITGIQVGSGVTDEKLFNLPSKLNDASDNILVSGTKKNTIENYISNKLIWKTTVGGNINDILINKYGVLISSSDNYLYQLNNKNGNKVWKIRFNNKVSGVGFLSENIGIVSIYAESKAYLLNFQKGKLLDFFSLEENEYTVSKPLTNKNRVFFQTNNRIICLNIQK
jgi:outer membrane protein assembly factor BamB